MLCSTLGVSRSGYYQYLNVDDQTRKHEERHLVKEMEAIHRDKQTRSYGSPRMTHELRHRGFACSENRVARIMRENGLRARFKRPFRPITTKSHQKAKAAPRLFITKQAKPAHPGEMLVGDITYVATKEGWLYLAVVMDYYSRTIVGWEISKSLDTPLIINALEKTKHRYGLKQTTLFHSDRGCQYTSRRFRTYLQKNQIHQSMSRRGNCYDNAACESVFATLKAEAFPNRCVFETQAEARYEIFEYIEGFYNTRRLHSSIDYQPPLTKYNESLNPQIPTLN